MAEEVRNLGHEFDILEYNFISSLCIMKYSIAKQMTECSSPAYCIRMRHEAGVSKEGDRKNAVWLF